MGPALKDVKPTPDPTAAYTIRSSRPLRLMRFL